VSPLYDFLRRVTGRSGRKAKRNPDRFRPRGEHLESRTSLSGLDGGVAHLLPHPHEGAAVTGNGPQALSLRGTDAPAPEAVSGHGTGGPRTQQPVVVPAPAAAKDVVSIACDVKDQVNTESEAT
jgi:hypothetical protein